MFKTMFPFEFILMSMKILCPGFLSTSVMKYPDKARNKWFIGLTVPDDSLSLRASQGRT